MPVEMPDRIERIYKRLPGLGLDALLLFDVKNIRYLTGFTGTDGILVIRAQGGTLLVDGRFLTQAGEQVHGVAIDLYRDKLSDLVALLSDGHIKTVGFESAAITYDIYARLKKRLHGMKLKPVGYEVRDLRKTKDGQELSLIARAIDISHQALMEVIAYLRPGVMEREIAAELDHRMKVLGAEDISFPTIVASGPRAALPHAEPGLRGIAPGDAVIIDYGSVVDGYHSDETCTFIVGDAGGEVIHAYKIVKEAHDLAIGAVRAGIHCREIDRIARDYISAQGFGDFFSHGTGHGVGLDVHEFPRLSMTSDAILEAGMVVTIEPGIYLPGKFGIRIEDMVLVKEDGCRVLTKTSKTLRIIN
ncbi:MAG: aminopeptidase P family protein [Syntrophales bacterium]|nr:aminopeptidase P family protein [Syntrophales bacterium]